MGLFGAEPESIHMQWVLQLTAAANLLPRTHSPWKRAPLSCHPYGGRRERCPSKVPSSCIIIYISDNPWNPLLFTACPTPDRFYHLWSPMYTRNTSVFVSEYKNLGLGTIKGLPRNILSYITEQKLFTEKFYNIKKKTLKLQWPIRLLWSYDQFLSAVWYNLLPLCFSHTNLLLVPLGLQVYYHLIALVLTVQVCLECFQQKYFLVGFIFLSFFKPPQRYFLNIQ